MSGSADRLARVASAFAVLAISPPIEQAFAKSETVANVTISGGVGYDRNPYLLPGPDTDAASVDVEVRPSIGLLEERGRLNLEGYYRRSEYLSKYSGTDSYGATLSGNERLSDTMTLTAASSYDSSIVSAASLFGLSNNELTSIGGGVTGSGGVVGTNPVAPAIPLVPFSTSPNLVNGDLNLIGLRQRRSLLSTSVGLNIKPNARDNWNFGVSGARARYPGDTAGASNYRRFGGNAGYSRSLSTTSSLGVTLAVDQINYDTPGLSSRVYAPQVTYSVRLQQNWSINAGVGVSIIDSKAPTGGGTSTSLALQASVCHAGQRSNLCLNGSRSAAASAFDGVRPQTSIRLSYDYRLDEKSSLDAYAGYNRTSGSGFSTAAGAQSFMSSGVSLRRELSRRAQVIASVNYQDVSSSGVSRPADIAARVGIVFKLGDLR